MSPERLLNLITHSLTHSLNELTRYILNLLILELPSQFSREWILALLYVQIEHNQLLILQSSIG